MATRAAIEAAEVAVVEVVVVNITEDPPTTTGGVTRRHSEKYCEAIKRIDPKLRSIPKVTREIEAGIQNEVGVKTTKTIKGGMKTVMVGRTISLKTSRFAAKAGVGIAEDTMAIVRTIKGVNIPSTRTTNVVIMVDLIRGSSK